MSVAGFRVTRPRRPRRRLPPPPPPTTVRASFTWSLPSLGGSVASPSATRTGTLALNACSSLGGTSGIHTYTWTARDVASGAVRTATTTTCQTFLDSRPLNGHWTVRLDITTNSGATASQTQDLPFRDALIATLGDSAASGEGDPDRAKANGSFADPRCDLSSHAASADRRRPDRHSSRDARHRHPVEPGLLGSVDHLLRRRQRRGRPAQSVRRAEFGRRDWRSAVTTRCRRS